MNVKHILKLKLEGIVYVVTHPQWLLIKYLPWSIVERIFSEDTIERIVHNKPDSFTPRLSRVIKQLVLRKGK